MQIRTTLLLLSLIGAISSALVVWYIAEEKALVQTEADADLRWEIYSDAWARMLQEENAKLSDFGIDGSRADFWRPENAQPLNFSRSTNRSNYFTDYSSSTTGQIENPMFKALMEGKIKEQADRYLTIFFGPALQRGQLLFFSIIDAQSLEQVTCRKSLFSRDYNPCSTIFETEFADVGSRIELYEEVISSGVAWGGYMVHSTPTESNHNLVSAFPLNAGQETRFIVIVGKSLNPLVKDFSEEMNIAANVFDSTRDLSFYQDELDRSIVAHLASGDISKHETLGDSNVSLMKIALDSSDLPSLWLTLYRDVSELLIQQNNYTLN